MHTPLAALAATLFTTVYLLGETESSAPPQWNRDSAIAFALENNAGLQAARLSVELAEARLDRTGLRPNPRFEVDYTNDFAFNNEGEYTLGVGFSQQFPLANRLKRAKEVSRVDIAKAKTEIRRQEIAVVRAIAKVALDIQIADTRIASLQRLQSKAEEIAAFIRSRVTHGDYSILEANQATLEARSLAQEINQLSDERNHLTHSLAPLMGLPDEHEIDFTIGNRIELETELPSFDDSVFERHPDLQLALLDAHSAEAEIALAEAENWEDVTARLFWKNERSVDAPIGLGTDRSLGVGLSIPLPLRKSGTLRAREQRIARDQSHKQAAAIKLNLLHEIEHARHETEDLINSLISYQTEVVELAKTQIEEIERAHQSGQISFLELMNAQRQLIAIEHDYLDTLEAYSRARLKLESALLILPGLHL